MSLLPILLIGLLIYLTACSESKFQPSPERIEPNITCGALPVPVEITGKNFMAIISEDLSDKERPEVDKLFRVILRHTESGEERSLGSIVFYNSTRLTAVVPGDLRSRWHDLIVTNPDGESGTLPEAFYVTSICSVGPTTGCPGDSVTISGTDFGTNIGTVSFNGTSATVTSWGNTSITVIAPGGNYAEVTVTPTPAAEPASLPGTYSYDDQPPTGLAASPVGGSYCATVVSLTISDGTIHYTLDGSAPTTLSPVYTTPISISLDTTLNFMAVDVCGNQSATMTEVYDIDAEGPTSLVASPAGGSYCATAVSLSASDGTIYYTTDGSVPTTGSTVYSVPIGISVTTTLNFMAVDVCGSQAATVTEVYDIDDEAVVNITSPEDGVTLVAGDVTVSGTADTNITSVTVTTDQGHSVSSGVDAGGNWSVVLTGVTVPSLTITARGVDNCGNIGSGSTINSVILPAQLTITKLVENLTRLLGPASAVDAISGDQIDYKVIIRNEGEENATLGVGDFGDLIPVGLTCDGPATVIGAISGALICNPFTGEVTITDPVVIPGPSTVIFTYRATVD